MLQLNSIIKEDSLPKKVFFFNTNEAKEEAKNEAENGHEDKQRVDRATRLSHGYL